MIRPACRSFRPFLHRGYHDYIRFATPGGSVRVPLSSPKVLGIVNSRGNRSHQEDYYAFATLSLPPHSLELDVAKHHQIHWNPDDVGDSYSRQVTFVGIYDGHGGSGVSQYLRQELHGMIESVDKHNIPELYAWIQDLGGYFKRFKGGALTPWIHGTENTPELDLEARLTQAFFEIDRNISWDPMAKTSGATASVALLHALDAPAAPFWSAQQVALTVAHCGDTRVLLSATHAGQAYSMTSTHHADAPVESARLRRMMGSALITDSFGESRWMGALANTRGLGDLRFKRHGVTAEPDVRTKLLKAPEWACVILCSDGITSILSDQEIVDLTRNAPDPKTAASRILDFAQELGGDDNATAIVVPLAGWGKVGGPDRTKNLREYRRKQAEGSERQRRM